MEIEESQVYTAEVVELDLTPLVFTGVGIIGLLALLLLVFLLWRGRRIRHRNAER